MNRTPDTSRKYYTQEHTFVTYNFGTFSTTLSNKRLIINNKQSSESIQLQQIRGVSIVDDYEQYSRKKADYIQKLRRWYQCAGALAGGIAALLLMHSYFFISVPVGLILGMAMSSFLPISAKSVATPSLLLVVTEQDIKEYPFQQLNGDVASLAKFLLQIEGALYR